MVERVDIQVTDQVAPSVASKLKEIADQADRGAKSLNSLKQGLSGLNPSALSRLAQANNEAATAALKNQRAAEQSAKATLDQQRASVQLQQANVRLQQANNSLAISEQKVAQQTANTAKAQIQAEQSATRLLQAQSRLSQQQSKTSGGTGGGSGVLFGVSAAAEAASILKTVDAYQLLENKLRSVTSSEQERVRVQDNLTRIANETFQTTDATVTLYQRLSSATKRYGTDENELYEIITNVGKAFALSGATAGEAQGAIVQLTQAIGGDFKSSSQELNTILEQAPILADVFAKQLGVTRVELKALAKEGQLSGKDFVAAFSDTGKGIAELQLRFGNLKLAISQAGVQFGNAFQTAVGKLAETSGAADKLVHGIQFLGDHMEIVLGVATAVFPVLVAGFVKSEFAAAAFNATVLRNPLFLGATLIAGAVVGLVVLKDKSEAVKAVWEAMAPVVTKAIDAMTGGLASAGLDQWLTNALFGLAALGDGIDTLTLGLTDFGGKLLLQAAKMQQTLDKSKDDAVSAADALKAGLEGTAGAASSASAELDGASKSAHSLSNADFSRTASGLQASTTWAGRLADELNRAGIAARAIGGNVVSLGPASAIGGNGVSEPLHKPINSITGKEWSSYATGGYTGAGTKMQPAGIVHAGEFVINKENTTRHRALLEAINNSEIKMPGYAAGGYARDLPNGGHIEYDKNGRITQYTPGKFNPASGGGGLAGWMNAAHPGGTPVGQFSTLNQGPSADQLAKQQEYQLGLLNWWADTKSTLKPAENTAKVGTLVGEWLGDIAKATVNPGYRYDMSRRDIGANGWAASVLQGAPPWSDTVGKYVKYAGPSYGGAVNYGGDPRDPVTYNLPPTSTTMVDPSLQNGLRRVIIQLDPNYRLPQFANGGEVFSLGGMAEGGSFTVPGYGGTDNKRVEMMAMPGETISVDRKGQGGKTVNVEINVTTPDASSFRKSRNQIMGEMSRQLQNFQDQN